jgi:hypothetical protein
MRAECKIEGCTKRSAGRGWCSTHWLRWRKHGDPLYVTPRTEYNVERRIGCLVDGCDAPHHAHGYCTRHATRFVRYGNPLEPQHQPTGRPLDNDRPTYTAIHRRLTRTRGKASAYACVDCGAEAREWSYDGGDPDEYQVPAKTLRGWMAVTENLQAYSPRCVPCHRRYDAILVEPGDHLDLLQVRLP